MSNEGSSRADQDLLARLNALKKTHIDLDDKQYRIPVTAHIQSDVDPSPAKALYGDLASRFNSLTGSRPKGQDQQTAGSNKDDLLVEDDNKTVEELLTELGGEGAWNIEKDEATQIDDLLRSANFALKDIKSEGSPKGDEDLKPGNTYNHDLPSIDIEILKPDPHSEDDELDDNDTPHKSKKELESQIDREADEIMARLKDELKNAPPDPESDDEESSKPTQKSKLPIAPAFDLPSIPTSNPEPATDAEADTDLASRFASLGLPSAPSNTLPSAPSSKPGKPSKFGSSARYEGHTNEEIDSWCIICCEDATLRCIGCDGDLYCAKCWVEGHRGPDAGYEERRHKAVEFNKGVKKEPRRRVAA